MHDFKIRPEVVEKIRPTWPDPKWRLTFRTMIAKTKEEAKKMDDEDSAAVQVYMDGSGKDSMIGAAAVLYRNGVAKRSCWDRRRSTQSQKRRGWG
jgi:hypothetical protein